MDQAGMDLIPVVLIVMMRVAVVPAEIGIEDNRFGTNAALILTITLRREPHRPFRGCRHDACRPPRCRRFASLEPAPF